VAGHAAVGVDYDLATRQACVPHRTAEHELAGRVDEQADVRDVEFGHVDLGEHRSENLLPQIRGEQVVEVDIGGVLRRDDHGVEANRLVAVVFDGDLGLAVRAQVRQDTGLTDLGETTRQAVRQRDRQRHQFRGVGGGESEHQTLVACALTVDLVVAQFAGADLVRVVDALRDLRGLCTDRDVDAAGVAVEALGRGVVPDLEHGVAHDLGDVGVGGGRDLTGDVNLSGGHQCLDGDAGAWVVGEERVEDGVADRITNLVRVPLGHRLTGE